MQARAAWRWARNFYPRPPRGGRRIVQPFRSKPFGFLSTPSARRATTYRKEQPSALTISIHALREEGDRLDTISNISRTHFYPRPPRGGRRTCGRHGQSLRHFYPRPPRGGRPGKAHLCCCGSDFYPRPPRGGRPHLFTDGAQECVISIHALREEGDMAVASSSSTSVSFLSTPSARRATRLPPKISVVYAFLSTPSARRATCDFGLVPVVFLFLSTPSARRATMMPIRNRRRRGFLSTPSARRATTERPAIGRHGKNFYPRPPRGGRRSSA